MQIPKHLAVVMDGNGRWAEERKLPAIKGHELGAQRLKELCEYCVKAKLPYLSVYAFSTENWKRPASEVKALMRLLHRFFDQHLEAFVKAGIRVVFAGGREDLEPRLRSLLKTVEERSAQGMALNLQIAFNYGGRDELLRAFQRLAKSEGQAFASLDEASIAAALDQPSFPDPDLLYRPGGEQRLSNFMLWQLAYTELYFSDRYWPDFTEDDFTELLAAYGKRQRRFGRRTKERL